jgi:two-component system alkaline phosphatase synthesis response regulator PhoP
MKPMETPDHILVVDDDAEIRSLLGAYLQKNGYRTTVAADGKAMWAALARTGADLIVLDLMLPGLDGFGVCKALRADPATAAIPVIMVTARADESDRVAGLELGADDYVTKPFSPRELTARVKALLRRAGPARANRLRYGPVTVDLEEHVVRDGEREVHLTAKEFLLLRYLLEHRGRVLSRDLLLSDVWGYSYTGGTRTVDVHVRRLREKLPVLAEGVATIKQFGYRLLDRPGTHEDV